MASTARWSREMAPWRAVTESFLPQLSIRDAKGDPLTVKICGTLAQQKPRSGSEARLDMAHDVGRVVVKREAKGRRCEREREREIVSREDVSVAVFWASGVWGERGCVPARRNRCTTNPGFNPFFFLLFLLSPFSSSSSSEHISTFFILRLPIFHSGITS